MHTCVRVALYVPWRRGDDVARRDEEELDEGDQEHFDHHHKKQAELDVRVNLRWRVSGHVGLVFRAQPEGPLPLHGHWTRVALKSACPISFLALP